MSIKIVMGSKSDWPTMKYACEILDQHSIQYDVEVVSAHRTPDKLFNLGKQAEKKGLRIIIAGAGGAAHLPGMLAAVTSVPVLGVPIKSACLSGMDSLYSIVQMPKGIPVATFAIGPSGAANAALFAMAILAGTDAKVAERLQCHRQAQTEAVLNNPDPRT